MIGSFTDYKHWLYLVFFFYLNVKLISSALISKFWLSTRFLSNQGRTKCFPSESHTLIPHEDFKNQIKGSILLWLHINFWLDQFIHTSLHFSLTFIYFLNYSLKQSSVGLDCVFSQSMCLLSWTSCMRLKVQYIRIAWQAAAYRQSNC